MNRQYAPALQLRRPAPVVRQGRIQAVAAVYEHHGQRRLPVPRRGRRAGHDGHDRLFQPGGADIATKLPETVHAARAVVKQRRVVKHLAGLVFLRAPVVVQGEQGAVVGPAGQAQVDSGLAAIAAYFQHRPARAGLQGVVVKGLGLIGGQEAFYLVNIEG